MDLMGIWCSLLHLNEFVDHLHSFTRSSIWLNYFNFPFNLTLHSFYIILLLGAYKMDCKIGTTWYFLEVIQSHIQLIVICPNISQFEKR